MMNPPVDFRLLAGAGVPARDFKAGDVIFREGDPAQELFIVQSGEVEIRLGNRVLETLPQHSIFGEMALIDNAPRSATAIAATDARLVPVSEKQFLFLKQYPVFCVECDAHYGAAIARGEYRALIDSLTLAPPKPAHSFIKRRGKLSP
jgi:CRP/FNR family transcriptional regulator, cyclic AMP receptor protein